MERPLRVLIVEDSEDDALLIVRTLKKGGFDPVHERVETAEGMLSALSGGSWDVVLCDYKMPRFSGLRALEIFREAGIDIPFILVSGTIGEEVAVEAMKAGAHDYIMKDRLQRLMPAIERELKEAAMRQGRKQVEQALRVAEVKYSSIVENALEGIYQSTPEGRFLIVNPAMARIYGYDSKEELIAGVTDIGAQLYASRDDRGEVMRLLNEDGFLSDFEVQHCRKDGSAVWVSLNARAVKDEAGAIVYLEGVVANITDRKRLETERQKSLEMLRKGLAATVQAISMAVEVRDPYTSRHQKRVADLVRAIATEMALPLPQVEGLRMASVIHDIGKLSIPSEILSKPSKLTHLEYQLLQQHAQAGYDILKDIDFPWPVARVILQHHERLDGSGYPNGIKEDEILLEARILSVADVVEAMATHRPYRPSLGIGAALEEVSVNRGVLYDPGVVAVCLRLFREKGYRLPD
jgi:PAS domain S-box-containing protein